MRRLETTVASANGYIEFVEAALELSPSPAASKKPIFLETGNRWFVEMEN